MSWAAEHLFYNFCTLLLKILVQLNLCKVKLVWFLILYRQWLFDYIVLVICLIIRPSIFESLPGICDFRTILDFFVSSDISFCNFFDLFFSYKRYGSVIFVLLSIVYFHCCFWSLRPALNELHVKFTIFVYVFFVLSIKLSLFLTFHLYLSCVMQTKRTKKAGIVGKYGKFN